MSVKTMQTVSSGLARSLNGAVLMGLAKASTMAPSVSVSDLAGRDSTTVPRIVAGNSNANWVLPKGTLYVISCLFIGTEK